MRTCAELLAAGLLVVSVIQSLRAQEAGADNLAPNPGFEIEDAAKPAFWSQRTPSDDERILAWDPEVFRSGKRSLCIANRAAVQSRWRTGHFHDISLRPGSKAELSAWIRTQNVTGGAHVRLYFIDAGRKILAQPDSDSVKGDSDWTRVSVRHDVPEATAYVMIYLELNGKGTAWYDDVVLTGEVEAQTRDVKTESLAYAAQELEAVEGYRLSSRRGRPVLEIRPESKQGRARVIFWGESARYHVTVHCIDEKDGQAELRMLLNGEQVAQWKLDETPEDSKDEDVLREKVVRGVDIQQLSRIVLKGKTDLGEYCRICSLSFRPVGRFQGKFLSSDELRLPPSLRLFDHPNQRKAARRMLGDYVRRGVSAASSRREQELSALKTPEDWRNRQRRTRDRLWEFLGDFQPKCPLNTRLTGKLDRADYVIEKIIFESQPRYYCTANFYVPKRREFPLPGVIFTCGHAKDGKAYHLYHEACLGLVLKGYVVIALDPTGQGERSEYFNPATGEPIVPLCVSQHHYLARPSWLVGRSLAGYRTWDCIRAVDYLVSRPEVDGESVAAVGNSGGGQMALLITAADERVKVCAAAHPGGSMENSYLAGQWLIDREVLSLIPPRPCAFIIGKDSGEAVHNQHRLNDMHRFYEGLGAGKERGQLFLVNGVHDMKKPKREAAYAWLNRWFGREGEGSEEPPLKPETVADLNCTPSGFVLKDLGGETGQTLNAKLADNLRPARQVPADDGELETLKQRVRKDTAARIGLRLAAEREEPPCISMGRFDDEDFTAEKLIIESEPGVRLPSLLFMPRRPKRGLPIVLHVSELGKPVNPAHDCLALRLVRTGHVVLSVDVRGSGETDPRDRASLRPLIRYDPQQFRFDSSAICCAHIETTTLAMRVFDVLRCLDCVDARQDLPEKRVVLLGEGLGGVWVLGAAAFDPRPVGVICVNTIPSYKLIVGSQYYRSRDYFWVRGALKDFDIPDLMALVAPRRLVMLNPRDAMLDAVDLEQRDRLCAWPVAVYRRAKAPDAFRWYYSHGEQAVHVSGAVASELQDMRAPVRRQ